MVGLLPDEDWWTVDTRGTHPTVVEEHPVVTRSGTSASSGLDFLSKSSRTVTAKQGAVALPTFPAYIYLFIYLFIPLELMKLLGRRKYL